MTLECTAHQVHSPVQLVPPATTAPLHQSHLRLVLKVKFQVRISNHALAVQLDMLALIPRVQLRTNVQLHPFTKVQRALQNATTVQLAQRVQVQLLLVVKQLMDTPQHLAVAHVHKVKRVILLPIDSWLLSSAQTLPIQVQLANTVAQNVKQE